MRSRGPPVDRADLVAEQRQIARRGDAGVLLAQAPGRRVARVREEPVAGRALPAVELIERGERHEHLAAHLELGGNALALQPGGRRGDRPEVLRHVFAGPPVAARGAHRKATVAVLQRDRETVELRLGDETDRPRHQPLQPPAPGHELLARERVVERQHRHAMLDRRERRHRPATRTLRRRVGRDELRVLRFDLPQLPHERVELRVGNFGRVEHEVLLVVVIDQLPKLLRAQLRDALRLVAGRGLLLRTGHAAQST